jgi:ferredoxin-NADP reductase
MIFRDELADLEARHDSLTMHRLHTDTEGMLDLADLDRICPDWRDRETWACGPGPMLDAVSEHFEEAGLEDRLHLERFSLELGGEAGRAAPSPFGTPARRSRSTARPPAWRPGRRPGSGCPTAVGWASATPAR